MRKPTDYWGFVSVTAGFLIVWVLLSLQPSGLIPNPQVISAYPIPGDVVPPRGGTGVSSNFNDVYLPIILKDMTGGTDGISAPIATRSRYIGQDYLRDATAFGQFTARNHPNGIIILDFGDPVIQSGVRGTYLPASTFFAPIDLANNDSDIKGFIQGYILGYCNDNPSSSSRLTVAVGTSNYSAYSITDLTSAHGQAWGRMIRDINDWLRLSANASCNIRVDVAGAMDLELLYAPYTPTRQWLDGYLSTAFSLVNGSSTYWEFYNFGDCSGCPTDANPSGIPDNGWTLENIYQVSGGILLTRAIPQMYPRSGVSAQQWYRVSLHGVTTHGSKIVFRGILSQHQACADVNYSDPGCNSPKFMDAPPELGWLYLHNKISSDVRTKLSSPIPWTTDISWRQVVN